MLIVKFGGFKFNKSYESLSSIKVTLYSSHTTFICATTTTGTGQTSYSAIYLGRIFFLGVFRNNGKIGMEIRYGKRNQHEPCAMSLSCDTSVKDPNSGTCVKSHSYDLQ